MILACQQQYSLHYIEAAPGHPSLLRQADGSTAGAYFAGWVITREDSLQILSYSGRFRPTDKRMLSSKIERYFVCKNQLQYLEKPLKF